MIPALHARTPCFVSPTLSRPKQDVWLKMECCQPAGSFKIRGIGTLCRDYAYRGFTDLLSSSGGNAGYAAAWAAKKLGMRIQIAVPDNTPEAVRMRLEGLGALVTVHGSDWQECHEWASAEAEKIGAGYVHPFDHPLIWEGHATIIQECVAEFSAWDIPPPTDILVAVGGGGLLAGVLRGIERFGRSENAWQPRIWGIETTGMASFAAAVKAGMPVALPTLSGVARSLGAREVAEGAFRLADAYGVRSFVLDDEAAVQAAASFGAAHRHLVEPACGAALAALDHPKASFGERILVLVCGGWDVVSAAQ